MTLALPLKEGLVSILIQGMDYSRRNTYTATKEPAYEIKE